MLIIGRDIISDFWREHKDAENALKTWLQIVEAATWQSFVELRQTYPQADLVGACVVFNIRGNNYRLIAVVNYAAQVVSVLYVLPHKEYDKDKWKKDCDC